MSHIVHTPFQKKSKRKISSIKKYYSINDNNSSTGFVDGNGTVTAKKEGIATITATTQDGNYKKYFTITVSTAGSSTDPGSNPNNPSASGNGTTNNPNASGNGTNTDASGNGTGAGNNGNPSQTEQSIMDNLGVTNDAAKQILDEAAKLGPRT